MKELEFFDALTGIDDAYVLEAHETPDHRSTVRFGGFRRAAVLAAAVMMMVVTVVATGGDFPISSGFVWGDMYSMVNFNWIDRDITVQQEDRGSIEVAGNDYSYHIYSTHGGKRGVASMRLDSGEMLEVVFEAYVLMPDGTLQYKVVSKQDTGRVAVFLTNEVEGESGHILTIRASFYRLTESGERILVRSWTNLLEQFTDGIVTSEGRSYWPEEPTEAKAILPEGSDVVIVIPDGDE